MGRPRGGVAIGERRWKRRLGIAAAVLVGIVLIAAAAVWYWRDLPRRKVQGALAARLTADVSVGGLSMDGLRHFIVKDLVVRRMAGQPRIGEVHIASLDVTGSLMEIQQARFTTLRAEGAVIRLVPPDPSIPPAEGPGVSPTVERLTLDHARVLLGSGPEAAPGGDPAIVVSGTLDRVGGDLGGELTLSAERLPIESLLAQVRAPGAAATDSGRLEALEGKVRVADGGKTIDAEARAARLIVPGEDGPVTLPSPSVEAHVRQDREGDPYRIEIRPVITLAGSLSASAVVDGKTYALVSVDARARGVDVAPVLALARVTPEGWKAGGRADLTVQGNAPSLGYTLEARLASVEGSGGGAGTLAASDVKASVEGTFAIGSGDAPMPLRGSLEIGAVRGVIQGRPVPESLAPVKVMVTGTITRGVSAALRASTSAGAATSTGAIGAAAPGPSASIAVAFEGQADLSSPPLGQVHLEGRASAAPDADLRWRWEGIDLARVAALAGAVGEGLPEGLSAEGQGRAEGTLQGTLAAPRIAGRLELTNLRAVQRPRDGADAAAASLDGGRASARFAWAGSSGPIEITALSAQGRVRAGALEPFDASLDADGRVDPGRGAVDVSRAAIEAKGLARLRVSGSARRDAASGHSAGAPAAAAAAAAATASSGTAASAIDTLRGSAAIHFEGVDLARLQKALRPITGDLAPGYAAKGDAEGDASVSLAPGGIAAGSGKAAIRRTGFSSSDGSQVLEGLDTSWDVSFGGRLTDPAPTMTLRATADVSGFQLLWGAFFVDGGKLTSKLDVVADLTRRAAGDATTAAGATSAAASTTTAASSATAASAPSRVSARITWTFPDGPRFAGTAIAASGEPLAWTLDAESRDLATTFERYVRAPLGDSIAFFRKIEAAGTAHVEARGRWSSDAPTVSGRLSLGDMRIAGTEKVAEVTGLNLDLPFDLAWGPARAGGPRSLSGTEQTGSVRFAHLTLMGLDVPATSTGLRVRTDTVEIEEGVAVALLDGVVGFERLKLIDLLSSAPHLESAMLVSGVSLALASSAFSLPPLEGTADAHFPRVRMSMDTLQVDGGGEVRVFGGSLKLGAISGEDILSRYPKLVFSADFEGIDLAKVTHTFDFGEMTGIVQGYVHGCELFRGVPTAFDARVETEERSGVSRTVNVKAIQNLTILGTGTRPSIFDRGIHKFFNEYTYSRIGIAMTLKDDVFVLRGLERRGDQELFVKGRLPFPINVVNAQPGAPISFQDMIERVKNLDVTAATVQK